MDNKLIITNSVSDLRLKGRLQKSILRKRDTLGKITAKVELLEMDLEFVRYEYDVRVGRLSLRDNQLDLEIIRGRNIKKLIGEGKTYAEAVAEVDDTYYAEQLAFEKEQERIAYEEGVLGKRDNMDDSSMQDLRSMWKKLVVKYHPDLVMDPEERVRREEVTKQINKAYREHDLDALRLFDSEYYVENIEESTITMLETILLDLENKILARNNKYDELRNSQWYQMKIHMERARKKGMDIFKELEKKLVDDVLRKIEILKVLKKDIGEFI